MKKGFIATILCCVLCILAIPTMVRAANNKNGNCYIVTAECPQEYIDYATENISKYVLSIDSNVEYDHFWVGKPFSFGEGSTDVFYFPIICDGNIKYLFRVYPDEENYVAAITEFLAKELNSLASKTSVDNPMSINRVGTKIIAIIGNEQYTLCEYPDDISNGNSNVNSREVQKRIIVDVKSSSDIELNLIQTRDVSKYITLNITETQAGNNWCVAYSLAAIIRTQTTFTTSARSIAIMALGANPSTQSTIPWDQVSTISKKFGLNPKVLNTTATNSVLTAELNAGRPCIIAMFPKSGNMGHAVVLRGYNSSGIWSIWNPWYSNYESYSMNGSYVPTGYSASELSLTAKMHAYNFK